MKIKTANIINYFELSDVWQKEARSNLDEFAEEASYLEPIDGHTPEAHVLWDLNEAMRGSGTHEGFEYNATIGISNNSAMLLYVDDAFETADYIIV